MSLLSLARGCHNNRSSTPGDNGRAPDSVSKYVPVVDPVTGKLVPASRILIHPGLAQVEGEGLYTYPQNPHITRGFILAPAIRVDASIQRTLGTNVLVQKNQLSEDTIVSEVWIGGGREVSTFTEMARHFHTIWTTPPPEGETLGWQPMDINVIRYNVKIVDVIIGSPRTEYIEVREFINQRDPSYLTNSLEVQYKPEAPVIPPTGQLTMEGL
jgi:hypothetical protein